MQEVEQLTQLHPSPRPLPDLHCMNSTHHVLVRNRALINEGPLWSVSAFVLATADSHHYSKSTTPCIGKPTRHRPLTNTLRAQLNSSSRVGTCRLYAVAATREMVGLSSKQV